jgi:tyrosyl-DNA phosphodiesterase-1
MIPQDWTNMCQAVWRSPLLPLLTENGNKLGPAQALIGSAQRFKRDLLAYLEAYGDKKTKPLVQQLRSFNFESIRAALIASVPSKQKLKEIGSARNVTSWGWPALKNTISQIPLHKHQRHSSGQNSKAHIVIQVSFQS